MTKSIIFFCTILLLLNGCASSRFRALTVDEKKQISKARGEEYYTKVNIWCLNPLSISSHNLHVGGIIPAGTKVKIDDIGGIKNGSISFSDDSGTSYRLTLRRKSLLNLMQLFNRYFSKENIMAEGGSFHNLSAQDQDNIKKGKLSYGMTKEAALIAYGYPPANMSFTPNLNSNTWIYIEDDSQNTTKVEFDNDRIVKIMQFINGRYVFSNYDMEFWIGHPKTDLVGSLGPPQQVIDDGSGGQILTYWESKEIKTPGYVQATTNTNVFAGTYSAFGTGNTLATFSPPQTHAYKAIRSFWVDKNGCVYKWAWKGE